MFFKTALYFLCFLLIAPHLFADGVGPKSPLDEVKKLVETGNAAAETELAERYTYGIGVQIDYSQAYGLDQKAAAQDDPRAEAALAYLYRFGYGAPIDPNLALIWAQKSADKGESDGEFQMGRLYQIGFGVPEDGNVSNAWYRKSFPALRKRADEGDPLAQHHLGYMYDNGIAVPVDPKEAIVWYRLARDQGDAEAEYNLSISYKISDRAQMFSCLKASAEKGFPASQNAEGDIYKVGEGVDLDYEQALDWYRKSAESGLILGMVNMARMYDYAKDEPQELAWYLKAAERGDAESQFLVGNCYETGFGTKKNLPEAIKWYRKAAATGNSSAYDSLTRLRITP